MKMIIKRTKMKLIRIVDLGLGYLSIIPIKKRTDKIISFLKRNKTGGFFAIERLPFSKHQNWKLKNGITIESFQGVEDIEVDVEANARDAKTERYKRLEQIFKQKWLGLQAIAIEKPWMSDKEMIQAQIESYGELYKYAVLKLKTAPKDKRAKAIVAKHNQSLKVTAMGNMMLQKFRGILEVKIENNAENVNKLLDIAQNIKLTKEELTQEKMEELLGLLK